MFEAALRRTAELYPPAAHEYVLITKSHGAATLALTPYYQYPTTEIDREAFIAKVRASFAAQLAAKLKNAAPLHVSASEKLVDDQGRAVVEKDGVVYWEQVGKLQIQSDAETPYLAERGGKPFVDKAGRRVILHGKSMRLAGTAADLLDSQGKPIELLAVLGRNLGGLAKQDAAADAVVRQPIVLPLLRTAAFASEVQTEKQLKLPIPEGAFIALPIFQPGSSHHRR